MNTQVGLCLDKWNSSRHFDQKDNCHLTFHYFRNWSAELLHSYFSVPKDAISIYILHLIKKLQTRFKPFTSAMNAVSSAS